MPVNLLTALVFLCFYVSLAFVPGSVTTGIETALGPLAAVAGVGAAGIATESVRLSGLGHSPSAILACRYHLTYLLAAVGVAWHWAGNGPPTIDWSLLLAAAVVVLAFFANRSASGFGRT